MRATPYFTAMPSALEDPAVPLPPQTLRFRTAEAPARRRRRTASRSST